MSRNSYIFIGIGACCMAVSMWLWVQNIAIPHQQAESAARGTPRGNLSDLYPRWLGARELLLGGRDPYAADITREIQSGYYGRPIDPSRPHDPKDQQAFAYPLYVVFVLAPTVRLPFPLVQRAFLGLLVLLTATSVLLWFGALGWRVSPGPRLLWIVLTLGSFPAIQGFKLQQLTLLVASLLAAAMSALAGGYLFLAGVLLAGASIKPQLVVLPIACLGIWTLGDLGKRQRLLWGFGLTMLLLIAASELLLPGWISEFRKASADYWRYTGGGRSVLDVELTPLWGRLVSALLVAVLLYWAWRLRRAERTPEFRWLLALVMATTLAVIPMFAPYNQVLLVPSLMVIVRALGRLWPADRLSRFFVVLTAASVFWPWLMSMALAMALLFVPGPQVQKLWLAPLFTNFAIPTLTLGLLLVRGRILRSASSS
jgi:hypothetical protein